MAKRLSGSSRHEKRISASEIFSTPLSKSRVARLERVAKMPDSAIDYSDIPSIKGRPKEVFIGKFYRPVKQQISLRVDADVLAWFRSHGGKYQTYMNEVLRKEMNRAAG